MELIDESQKYYVKWKKKKKPLHKNPYCVCDSIYIKFQNKQI